MSAHTPGPWIVGRCSWNDEGNVCYELEGIKQGRAADSRLITAAPDLLAVLQDLQESAAYWSEYDVPLGIVDRINTAIAKATGAKP